MFKGNSQSMNVPEHIESQRKKRRKKIRINRVCVGDILNFSIHRVDVIHNCGHLDSFNALQICSWVIFFFSLLSGTVVCTFFVCCVFRFSSFSRLYMCRVYGIFFYFLNYNLALNFCEFFPKRHQGHCRFFFPLMSAHIITTTSNPVDKKKLHVR